MTKREIDALRRLVTWADINAGTQPRAEGSIRRDVATLGRFLRAIDPRLSKRETANG